MEVTVSQSIAGDYKITKGRVPLDIDNEQYAVTKEITSEEFLEILDIDKSKLNDKIYCILYDLDYNEVN